ncbi:MAG: peptide deformylase [Planctomycetes bacterium]|nr:peptide deformylase [Planctomycetota bacterium]
MEIKIFPDPKLRVVADKVQEFGEREMNKTIKEMFRIMYECGGIGLAGTQIGLDKRIVVCNLEAGSGNKTKEQVFINPRILKRKGTILSDEGCLSLPGIRANLNRYKRVKVEYFDEKEKKHLVEAEELLAILFQHEIDHLDGMLIIDRMSMSQKAAINHVLKEFEEDFNNGKVRKSEKVDNAL